MPKELPRVDLEHPSDLDFIVHAVGSYANAAAKERLRSRSHLAASPLEDTLAHAIERWTYAARTRLQPNVLVNGLPFAEYAKQACGTSTVWRCAALCAGNADAAAIEPFDEHLAERVNALSDQVDATTEQVVECRRRVPGAIARAAKRRSDALDAFADAREDARRRNLRKSRRRTRYDALSAQRPVAGKADARERSAAALGDVYAQLHELQSVRSTGDYTAAHTQTLPARERDAHAQLRLVQHLRTMAP